ncbi:MlaA family lipoprotein [Celeribacter litoreus]|uniref:MlaA family lipoprotein n=1 Tax=Celeribacter litoreus TaxID=2876714 RepID=UPI001CCCF718|nr:VacJ family lipoprotein [Celeribacter litoreus]MCA0042302.1 VacJ family lipoprotein [Celeribacter litoreus]
MFRVLPHIILTASALLVAGCSAPGAGEFNDPYEDVNRSWHETNTIIDRGVIDPVSTAYGTVVPDPVRRGVSNVSDTLSLPGMVVNDVLQLQLGDAVHNTARFALNATLGIGGLFDPASEVGLEERESDFGETLHVWGVREGAYLVLPLYGPSTERDAAGLLVDIALDPVGHLLGTRERDLRAELKAAELADTRYRYSDLYESVLYESADSYSQMRLSYLDNRRYALGVPIVPNEGEEEQSTATYDIYEDFYE